MTRSANFYLGVLALAGCVVCSPVSFAADDGAQSSATTSARPRVGLVLAGGGAKGGAHVGVLKALEEMNVPIDCIAGTSMGALVGGGYASGIPAAELEKFVTGIDWKAVVGGVGRRELETIEADIHAAEAEAQRVETLLSAPDFYATHAKDWPITSPTTTFSAPIRA